MRLAGRKLHQFPRRARAVAGRELARALELEAAFQVLAATRDLSDALAYRRLLAAMPPRDLHAAVALILHHIPARRLR